MSINADSIESIRRIATDIEKGFTKEFIIHTIILERGCGYGTAQNVFRAALSTLAENEREKYEQNELVRKAKERILKKEKKLEAEKLAREEMGRNRILGGRCQ